MITFVEDPIPEIFKIEFCFRQTFKVLFELVNGRVKSV